MKEKGEGGEAGEGREEMSCDTGNRNRKQEGQSMHVHYIAIKGFREAWQTLIW